MPKKKGLNRFKLMLVIIRIKIVIEKSQVHRFLSNSWTFLDHDRFFEHAQQLKNCNT